MGEVAVLVKEVVPVMVQEAMKVATCTATQHPTSETRMKKQSCSQEKFALYLLAIGDLWLHQDRMSPSNRLHPTRKASAFKDKLQLKALRCCVNEVSWRGSVQ